MVINVADDLTGARRQAVNRHEFGHSVGLGHNGGNCVNGAPPVYNNSVMRCDTAGPFVDAHDQAAMAALYPNG